MAISGLVIILKDDPDSAARALRALAADPRITLGERFGRRVAAVGETADVRSDRDLWDDLRANQDVEYVDVTFVGVDAPPASASRADGETP